MEYIFFVITMAFSISGFELALWWFWQVYLAGAIASLASSRKDSRRFYNYLRRPSFAPPPWTFGVVWFVMYGILAYAAYRVRTYGAWQADVNLIQLILFEILLVIITIWSWLFFRWGRLLLSLIDIALSWLVGVAVTVLFWIRDWIAGLLLTVFMLWISYATLLMIFIYLMNRNRNIPACDSTVTSSAIEQQQQNHTIRKLKSHKDYVKCVKTKNGFIIPCEVNET